MRSEGKGTQKTAQSSRDSAALISKIDLVGRDRIVKQPCVYILASKRNGTLYTGVTSAMSRRIYEHKNHMIKGFTDRYGVDNLVWYEFHPDMLSAISREKQIKGWNRAWKVRLIEKDNPGWCDLYRDIT